MVYIVPCTSKTTICLITSKGRRDIRQLLSGVRICYTVLYRITYSRTLYYDENETKNKVEYIENTRKGRKNGVSPIDDTYRTKRVETKQLVCGCGRAVLP